MSPFKYRLEKVLKYRENKKKEQEQRVIKAQQEVMRIQNEIDQNKSTIVSLRQSMYQSGHMMLESYDLYIKHLHEVIDQLEYQKAEAIRRLEEERRILEELDRSIKALEKHKEKKKEEYIAEEKRLEMKTLNEVGSQKHFRKNLERIEEERIEEEQQYWEDNDYQ